MKNSELQNIAQCAPQNAEVLLQINGPDDPMQKIVTAAWTGNPARLLLMAGGFCQSNGEPLPPVPDVTANIAERAVTPREVKRRITTHQVNEVNEGLQILVFDDPGPGGANHEYAVHIVHSEPGVPSWVESVDIRFQKGGIATAGVNGLTQEVLLAIVIDRLECFQRGPYACRDNADALEFAEEALASLLNRTIKRTTQGVEGKELQHVEPVLTGASAAPAPAETPAAPSAPAEPAAPVVSEASTPAPAPAPEPTATAAPVEVAKDAPPTS